MKNSFTLLFISLFFGLNAFSENDSILTKWSFLDEPINPTYFYIEQAKITRTDGLEINGVIQFNFETQMVIANNYGRIVKVDMEDVKMLEYSGLEFKVKDQKKLLQELQMLHRVKIYNKLNFKVSIYNEKMYLKDDPNSSGKLEYFLNFEFHGKVLMITADKITILNSSGTITTFKHDEVSYYKFNQTKFIELAELYLHFYQSMKEDRTTLVSGWENRIKSNAINATIMKMGAPDEVIEDGNGGKIYQWQETVINEIGGSVTNAVSTTKTSSYSQSYYASSSLSSGYKSIEGSSRTSSSYSGRSTTGYSQYSPKKTTYFNAGGISRTNYSSSIYSTNRTHNSGSGGSITNSNSVTSSKSKQNTWNIVTESTTKLEVFVNSNNVVYYVFHEGVFFMINFGDPIKFMNF